MDKMLVWHFQRQVRDQCRFLLMAAENATEALAAYNNAADWDTRHVATDHLWFSLQNMLNAAANVSKALWGQHGKQEIERQPLRETLEVPDDSPLRLTDMRNHFEHFDERLDTWYATGIATGSLTYFDHLVGPKDAFYHPDAAPKQVFRHFDPSSGLIRFWGDEFDLSALVSAASELFARADATSAEPPSPR